MAENKPFDLGAMFGEAVTRWERSFDENANRIMGTEAYSQWMNQMQSQQLTMQKAFGEFMTQQLQMMELPTREDTIQLSEALLKLDKRLGRIERTLKKMTSPSPADRKRRPSRNRQAVKLADNAAPDAGLEKEASNG